MGDAMNGLMRKVELEGSARSFASEGVRRCVVGQVQRGEEAREGGAAAKTDSATHRHAKDRRV